jgi:hypothetical protein
VYLEKRVRELLDSNLFGFTSAYECTQFIRGTLFYYVDSLVTMSAVINQEDLQGILNFLELVFKLTLKWYEILPALIPAWKENQTTKHLF